MQLSSNFNKLLDKGFSNTILQRFYSRIQFTDSCWIWTGIRHNGYGTIGMGPHGTGNVIAHRLSWEIHIGPIPDGMCVLHDCPDGDNRACVNPAHLWVGTRNDNAKDMVRKGRQSHNYGMHIGEKCGTSKLKWVQIREIRRLLSEGKSIVEIAKLFGVGETAIGYIRANKTWIDKDWIPPRKWVKKIHPEDAENMLKLRENGATYASIAKQYGISTTRAGQICRGGYTIYRHGFVNPLGTKADPWAPFLNDPKNVSPLVIV